MQYLFASQSMYQDKKVGDHNETIEGQVDSNQTTEYSLRSASDIIKITVYSCDTIITVMKRQFIRKVETGGCSKLLLQHALVCSKFVENNEYSTTAAKIKDLYELLKVPIDYNSLNQVSFGFDRSLKEEYKKLGLEAEIQKIISLFLKKFSCESVIQKIKEGFVRKIERGTSSWELLGYSQICWQLVSKYQRQSTVSIILAYLKLLGVQEPNREVTIQQLFGSKLAQKKTVFVSQPRDRAIKFDHSLKEEYRKLGVDKEISRITSIFSCQYVIKTLREHFIRMVLKGTTSIQLFKFSETCLQFVRNNQYSSTVLKLSSLLDSLGEKIKKSGSQLFGQSLQSYAEVQLSSLLVQTIKFDKSLRQEYKKLEIEELLKMKPKEEYSKDDLKLIVQGGIVNMATREYPYNGYRSSKEERKPISTLIRALLEVSFTEEFNEFKCAGDVSIIAPMWRIEGETYFLLDDMQCVQQHKERAKDGLELRCQQLNYQNGLKKLIPEHALPADALPGRPGLPGSAFLAIGLSQYNTMQKKSSIIIYAGGTPGGKGQDAGNGPFIFPSMRNMLVYVRGEEQMQIIRKLQSGKRGGGGFHGASGIVQIYFEKTNQENTEIYKKQNNDQGKQGPVGQHGKPGLLQRTFIRPIYGTLNMEIVRATQKPKPAQPVGYHTIVGYQKFLAGLITGKGVQKDIAYLLLKKFISHDYIKKYCKPGTTYSKLDIISLIGETNVIIKVYNNFLFQQDLLTTQQMSQLISIFKQKLIKFIEQESIQMNLDTEEVFRKIVTNVVIIQNSLKTANTVVNFDYIRYFLEKTKASFQYKQIVKQQTKVKSEYFDKLKQKIKQSEKVADDLQKQIKQVTDKLNDETKKLQQELVEAQQKKQQYAKKLRKQLPLKIMANIFGFAGKVAGHAGPKGKIAGAVLGGVSSVMEMLSPPPDPISGKNLNPATYLNMDNGLDIPNVTKLVNDLRQINPSLKSTDQIVKDIQTNKTVKQYLDYTEKSLENTNQILQSIEAYKKDKKQQQAKQKQEQKSKDPNNQNKDKDKDKNKDKDKPKEPKKPKKPNTQKNKEEADATKKRNKLVTVGNALKALQIANEGVKTIKSCFDAADEVGKAQKDSEEFKKMRKEINNFVNSTMKNFIQRMRNINEVFSNAGTQAKVLFLQYGFKATLNDMLHYFKSSFKQFESDYKQNVYYLFSKLEAGTQTLSQIHGVIENYKSQGDLASLIVGLSAPLGQDLDDQFPGLSQMEDNFQKVVVFKEGSEILNSFKQSSFPRSPYYSYDAYYSITNKDPAASVDDMMQKLQDIYHQHMINRNMLGGGGSSFIKTHKNAQFFTFREELEIECLLQGKTVSIISDVRLSPQDKYAIKFQTINIKFQLAPQATQEVKASFEKINQRLQHKNTTVEMSSSGNYFYRYGGTYYNLPSAQLELERSYKDEGIIKNQIVKVVQAGEAMFSPYTSWKIKLEGFSFTDPNYLKEVEKCKSSLLLKFYGNAVYIDKHSFGTDALTRIPVHRCYKSFETKVFDILPKA